MVDLARSVQELVRAATSQAEPRELRGNVEVVLDGFAAAKAPARASAVKAIGKAIGKGDGRGGQVLCLALGALVEGGAPPELAWPAVTNGLADLLERAAAFATAAMRHSKKKTVEPAIKASGAIVGKKSPRDAEAWNATPARCLAAIACLTRSKKVRAKAGKDAALLAAAWLLSDVMPEAGDLLQALRILDDAPLLVLAPSTSRGWRVRIDEVASNAELYVLLADALVGGPRDKRLPGKRPDARSVRAIREGVPPKKESTYATPFHLLAWSAVDGDGAIVSAPDGHIVSSAGLPADIPELDGERVVLVHESLGEELIPIEPAFDGLHPEVTIDEELSAAAVVRALVTLARASAKLHEGHRHPRTKKRS